MDSVHFTKGQLVAVLSSEWSTDPTNPPVGKVVGKVKQDFLGKSEYWVVVDFSPSPIGSIAIETHRLVLVEEINPAEIPAEPDDHF